MDLRALVCLAATILVSASVSAADCVVLMHGLARTDQSMKSLEVELADEGFQVANVSYPSREHPVETLSVLAVERGLSLCAAESKAIHFVTHSLGGILLRDYLTRHKIETLGRVVMLAPPNQGSEVVDQLRDVPGFELINGPAGMELGTDPESVPSKLGPVDFELGVIAGSKTINLILSTFIPGPNDGKVSIENTKVEGMTDFIVVPHSHPFIMNSEVVIRQTISFLKTGSFEHDSP